MAEEFLPKKKLTQNFENLLYTEYLTMKLLIIEDETPAAKRLQKLIKSCRPHFEILTVIDGVEASAKWLSTNPAPDLIFMDIQLSDGISFDIFTKVPVEAPVIFTTAYDEYSLKAFKVNSIDYLLKPIEEEELESAFQKFEKLHQQQITYNPQAFQEILNKLTRKNYKERFLVKAGQNLINLSVADVSYFYSEEGMLYARCTNSKRHMLDHTLEQVEDMLNPKDFFRINRKALIRISAIDKIQTHINSRLKLQLLPTTNWDVIVSRERVGDFKDWLDR